MTVFDLPSEEDGKGEGDEGADKGVFDVGEVDITIEGGGGGCVGLDDEGEVDRRG